MHTGVPVAETRHLLLLGCPPELQDLMESFLSDEGHAVRLGTDISVATVLADTPPDVIILITDPHAPSLALLDSLRATPETAAIPVIVLSTLDALQVQAQSSGNVYTSLPMPFDLHALLEAVQGALARIPFEARVRELPIQADPALERAADLLVRAEREIMLNWVMRIRQVEPFRERTELSTREFLDSLPRILNALALVLRRQLPPEVLLQDEDARGRVRAHADLRHQQGIPAEAVVREYQVLREVLTAQLRTELVVEEHGRVLDELNELLDGAVRVTVAEYTNLLQGGPERGAGFTASVES
jgi:DNA-binding response OmpR family regulator